MTNEELAVRIQAGEQHLMGELWEQNIKTLEVIAFRLYRKRNRDCVSLGVELKDIDQLSFFVIVDAVEAFKPQDGFEFTSYLQYPYLKHLYALLGIRNTKKDGKYTLVSDVLCRSESLNEIVKDGDSDTERLDMLVDPNSKEPYEDVLDGIYQSELRGALENALHKIPEEYSHVIRERYFNGKTLKEISAALAQSAYYIESRALLLLKRDLELQAFHDEIIGTWAYRGTGFKAFKETGMSSVERTVIKVEDFFKGNIQRCRILECIENAPKATQKEMSEILGLSESQVHRHMSKLRKDGCIKRVGSRCYGEWVVIKNE